MNVAGVFTPKVWGGLLFLLLVSISCGEEEIVKVEPVTKLELTHACVAATSCKVKSYPRVSDCVTAYYNLHRKFGLGPIYDEIYKCTLKADGECDEVFYCFGAHRYAGDCDSSFAAKCEDGRAMSCDLQDKRVYSYRCATAGLTCAVRDKQTFEAYCTSGTCKVSSFMPKCDNNRVVRCVNGVIEVEDCAASGLICGKDATTGASRCIGESTSSCNSQYKSSCNGAVAKNCVGGKVHVDDCAARQINRSCKNGACVPTGTQCTDQFNRCKDENTLEYCVDGYWQSVKCSELGFGKCRAVTIGNGARCWETI